MDVIAAQCDSVIERYKHNLSILKESALKIIDAQHEQNDEYKAIKQQRDECIHTQISIIELKTMSDDLKHKILDKITKEINMLDCKIANYCNDMTNMAIIRKINRLLREPETPLIIDTLDSDYIKDYEKCMEILKPCIDQEIKCESHVLFIKLKKSTADYVLLKQLQQSITYGKDILGFYVTLDAIDNFDTNIILRTIFSYLGFVSDIADHSYYVLYYEKKHIQRFYTNIDAYTTNPTYAHDIAHFKERIQR